MLHTRDSESRPFDPRQDDFRIAGQLVQPRLNRLTGPSGIVQVQPRVMQVLTFLASHAGEPLSREEILDGVWGSAPVGEESLTHAIFELRRLFGEQSSRPNVIETIRKVGYRLIATVEPAPDHAAAPRPSGAGGPRRRGLQLGAAAAGVALLALLAALLWPTPRPSPQPPRWQPRPFTAFTDQEFQPALSPDGRQVAFAWFAGQVNPDIYLKGIDADRVEQLTDHPAWEDSPVWSPDGRMIAFVRWILDPEACAIVQLELETRSERRIGACPTHSESALSWSPDGRYLAVANRDSVGRPSRLYLLALASGAVEPITRPPDDLYGDFDPAFSPDGRRIAFVRAVTRTTIDTEFAPYLGELYYLDLEPAEPFPKPGTARRITRGETRITGFDWLPGGEALLYGAPHDGKGYALWRAEVSGAEPVALFVEPAMIRYPSVARDGSRLVYESWQGDTNIWLAAAGEEPGTGRHERLLASTYFDFGPQYSPDGEQIVFTSSRSGSAQLWISPHDGSAPRQLTTLQDAVPTAARWSPDGTRIVFEAGEGSDQTSSIYLTGERGTTLTRLTDAVGSDKAPSFSRDGRTIYFGSDRSGSWQIWRVPVSGGEPQQVTRSGGFAALEGADGLYFTYLDRPGIWRLTDGDGEPALVVPDLLVRHWGNWQLSGHGLYFVRGGMVNPELVWVDLGSGERRTITSLNGWIHTDALGVNVSPTRNELLYTRLEGVSSDLMLIELDAGF